MRLRSRGVLLLLATLLIATRLLAAAPVPAIVSSVWLSEQLAATPASVALIDARPSMKDYLTGHIPGAQPLVADNVRSVAGGVPGTLFPWEGLHMVIHRLGLGPATQVVVYSQKSDIEATYVAMVLRLSGIPQVSVLDGGFDRWMAEQRPVTKERKLVAPSRDVLTPDAKALATIDDVKAAVQRKDTFLLDVRPAEHFNAGHIPGARNRFWMKSVIPDGQLAAGSFGSDAEIKADFEALGLTKEMPVIVYCNSGHQASEAFYMLKYRLGYPNVRLFDGSWLEWSMTPGTPKEVTPPPTPAAAPGPAKG
jgi:thiosulfate/3-mercaptopyruvate sulfurtransferase